MERAREALKKLNVFAQLPPVPNHLGHLNRRGLYADYGIWRFARVVDEPCRAGIGMKHWLLFRAALAWSLAGAFMALAQHYRPSFRESDTSNHADGFGWREREIQLR
jgi:hypothetical protein